MNRPKSGIHPEKALSPSFCRTVKTPGKYVDGNGLNLIVAKSGSKRWIQRIVIRGKRCEIGLGSFGLVGLAEARIHAVENRKVARAGGDPLAEKKRAESILTFDEATRQVQEANAPTWRNAKHRAQFYLILERYAFPRIGHLRVSEVTTDDVLAVLAPIWLEKPETARRVRQRMGKVLQWARVKGWRNDDPTSGVEAGLPKQPTTVKHHRALPYSEVAGCIETVQASGADSATKLAMELLILTALRSSEVRLAQWGEIDLDQSEWIVPGERMKMNREHRVPLSDRAIEILTEAKDLDDGSGLVFPSKRYGRPLSDMTLSKLMRDLGIDGTPHGFRTSFKTWCQEWTNVPNEVSEMALAHAVGNAVERAYARSDLFEKRRELMRRWSGYVAQNEGKVIQMVAS